MIEIARAGYLVTQFPGVTCSEPLITTMTERTTKTCDPEFDESFALTVEDASKSQLEVTLWDAGSTIFVRTVLSDTLQMLNRISEDSCL